MTTSDVSVMATEYAVCALPPEHPWFRHYTIKVRLHDLHADGWMVAAGDDPGPYLGADGEWSIRERTREWQEAHQFDRDTALALAKTAALNYEVDGRTVADVLSRAEGKR